MQQQLAPFLATCAPDQRRFHEGLFAYGNSAYIYHQRANGFQPNINDYKGWLEGLPENIGHRMQEARFDDCKTLLPFRQYAMEKNDIRLKKFIRYKMGVQDYAEYRPHRAIYESKPVQP